MAIFRMQCSPEEFRAYSNNFAILHGAVQERFRNEAIQPATPDHIKLECGDKNNIFWWNDIRLGAAERQTLKFHCSDADFIMYTGNYFLLWDALQQKFTESQLEMAVKVHLHSDNPEKKPFPLPISDVKARAAGRLLEFRKSKIL